jgi:hypothetical protein
MIGVIIAAEERDKKLWGTLPRILIDHLAAAYPVEKQSGAGGVVICRPEEARQLATDHTIVICGGEYLALGGLATSKNTVAVVDSTSAATVEQIGGIDIPAITCGFSARDTLTLTSFDRDSAVLCVQRSITCFDSALLEPQEIPFSLSGGIDSFVLMAAAAVFLLTGNAEKLKNAVI